MSVRTISKRKGLSRVISKRIEQIYMAEIGSQFSAVYQMYFKNYPRIKKLST